MSEVKRFGHTGSLIQVTPKILEIYPSMTVYVLAADFDRVVADNQAHIAKLEQSEKQMQETVDLALSAGTRVAAERDALQQRLNKSDQDLDETMAMAEKVLAEAVRLLERTRELETQLADREQSRRAWFDQCQELERAAALNPTTENPQ